VRLAELQFSDHGRRAVARLTGDIDLSNAEEIRRAIGRAIPNHALVLTLDLNQVDFLDSAGIQLIYHLREDLRRRGQTLQLAMASSSPSHDALKLAGMEHHVEIVETLDDASWAQPEVHDQRD
jgi:anti-sigma B factor antagonist